MFKTKKISKKLQEKISELENKDNEIIVLNNQLKTLKERVKELENELNYIPSFTRSEDDYEKMKDFYDDE